MVYCYELFIKRPDILKKWQEHFQYIQIDEFQDINMLQYRIIRMLAAPQNNLFAVGTTTSRSTVSGEQSRR